MPAARRRMLLALVPAALAACDGHRLPPMGAAPAERAPPLTAAAAAGPPLFVGRWAVSRLACASSGWELTATGLKSPSALGCAFAKTEPTSAGYTVYAVCTVGKASQPTRLILTFSGQGASRGITLTGGPFTEPVALSRCPAGVQAAESATPPGSSAPA